LSEFKPNFYDLLLVDINMPHMNGFELCEKMLAIDIDVKVCFMSSGKINREALRDIHIPAGIERDISITKFRMLYQETRHHTLFT
jgi:CheY-like chemotaxis protein